MGHKKNSNLRSDRDNLRRKRPTEGKAWTTKTLEQLKKLAEGEKPCE